MTASRFGKFINGRQLLLTNWADLNSPSSSNPVPLLQGQIESFNYTDVEGIYDLTSTSQFPNPVITYNVGFSPVLFTLSGQLDAWTQRTVDISGYAGATVRLVFHYINTANFTGDIQLDQIDLDGNVYSFENVTHGFETSSADDQATYNTVTWSAVTVVENSAGNWQVDAGGTPSANTGRTDAADGTFYVYAETSAPANVAGYDIWLRSPQITLSGAPTLTFFEARLGAGIGQLDVHLDVIA
jgi:hypothetical protein